MFDRIAIRYLRQWAEKEERKPLVLRGARQVGKTTLVNLFAKDFDSYIYLNLEEKDVAALQALRYFYEKRPDLYVIAAGSLLFLQINKLLQESKH